MGSLQCLSIAATYPSWKTQSFVASTTFVMAPSRAEEPTPQMRRTAFVMIAKLQIRLRRWAPGARTYTCNIIYKSNKIARLTNFRKSIKKTLYIGKFTARSRREG